MPISVTERPYTRAETEADERDHWIDLRQAEVVSAIEDGNWYRRECFYAWLNHHEDWSKPLDDLIQEYAIETATYEYDNKPTRNPVED